jgi:hypothetical protein
MPRGLVSVLLHTQAPACLPACLPTDHQVKNASEGQEKKTRLSLKNINERVTSNAGYAQPPHGWSKPTGYKEKEDACKKSRNERRKGVAYLKK